MVPVLLTGWAPNRTLISRSHTLLRRKGCGYPRDTTMADSDIVANPYDGLPPNDRKRYVLHRMLESHLHVANTLDGYAFTQRI